MSKREIDALMAAIPEQVKAAHASVKNVNTKDTEAEGGKGEGYEEDSSVIICPSDYGFDMFGSTGPEYIKERSREIAKASLAVHGKTGGGTDHADHDAYAGLKGGKKVDEVETSGILEGEDEDVTLGQVKLSNKAGSSQGVN
jgi:hypothetical protein